MRSIGILLHLFVVLALLCATAGTACCQKEGAEANPAQGQNELSCKINSPLDNQIIRGSAVTISGVASSPDTIEGITCVIGNENVPVQSVAQGSTASWRTEPWDSTSTSDGPHTIKVTVEDAKGQSTSDSISIVVDNFSQITATAEFGGTLSPAGVVSVPYGQDQEFVLEPKAGFYVKDVLVDDISIGAAPSYAFTNVVTDHTIKASFTSTTHKVTATAGPHGSVSLSVANPDRVPHGSTVTCQILPDTGYHVDEILLDGESKPTQAKYTFQVTRNHTLHATFAINTYTLTPSAGSGGHIALARPGGALALSEPTEVHHGSTHTLEIVPEPGYEVVEVWIDGLSQGNATTHTLEEITQDHTIEATFVQKWWVFDYRISEGTMELRASGNNEELFEANDSKIEFPKSSFELWVSTTTTTSERGAERRELRIPKDKYDAPSINIPVKIASAVSVQLTFEQSLANDADGWLYVDDQGFTDIEYTLEANGTGVNLIMEEDDVPNPAGSALLRLPLSMDIYAAAAGVQISPITEGMRMDFLLTTGNASNTLIDPDNEAMGTKAASGQPFERESGQYADYVGTEGTFVSVGGLLDLAIPVTPPISFFLSLLGNLEWGDDIEIDAQARLDMTFSPQS